MNTFVPKTDQPFSVRGTEVLPGDSLEEYLGKLARITLEEMLQPVGVLTVDGVILECNRAALATGGFTRADVVGRPFWEAFSGNGAPATQELLRDAVRRASAGEPIRCDVEVTSRTPPRTATIVDFTLLPVRDDEGRVILLLYEGRDVTEKRAHERAFEQERRVADALQRALIMEELPKADGVNLHARYRPARAGERVGGDWYDAFAMPDGRLFIAVGDVTGHGIAAITLMSRLRHLIIASALREEDPGAILTAANRGLLKQAEVDSPLGTAVCAFVDPRTREISYATAGHPAPILACAGGNARLLNIDGIILGLQGHVYHTHVTSAAERGLLVFYTDGLSEFTRDVMIGEENLLRAAGDAAFANVLNPALTIKQRILGESSPHDDVAIVTVRFEAA